MTVRKKNMGQSNIYDSGENVHFTIKLLLLLTTQGSWPSPPLTLIACYNWPGESRTGYERGRGNVPPK